MSDALDRKKWRNLIRGGKGDSGEGSSDIEWSVFLFDLVPAYWGYCFISNQRSLTCLIVYVRH